MSEAQSVTDESTTQTASDLTAFQQNILEILSEEAMYGLAIKRELESYYDSEVNHGRLYPNLDDSSRTGSSRRASSTSGRISTSSPRRATTPSSASWSGFSTGSSPTKPALTRSARSSPSNDDRVAGVPSGNRHILAHARGENRARSLGQRRLCGVSGPFPTIPRDRPRPPRPTRSRLATRRRPLAARRSASRSAGSTPHGTPRACRRSRRRPRARSGYS